MTRRTVYICRDFMQTKLLDSIQQGLEADGIEVIRGPEPTPGKRLVHEPASLDALFGRAEVMMFSSRSVCSREVMLAAPRLRGIVNAAIGVDTVDLEAAAELGIIVGNGALEENFLGMAEATVMFMMMLGYGVHRTEQSLRDNLPRPPSDGMWARMMKRRTVGLVGFGRIAQSVVALLSGFNMDILVHSPRAKAEDMPAGVRLVDLDTLLKSSDFVSVHVSLNAGSRGMIGEREFALMKPEAYLINTARGDVIDEPALIRALSDKRIAGAALDTFAVEPLPKDSPLRTLDNVILTPHMVGHTRDLMDAMVPTAIANIRNILAGEPPVHCRNPAVLPAWRARLATLPSA